MSEIGDKVKKIRMLRGISQRKLAKLADLSNDYISKIELGTAQNVGIVTLGRIAHALEISVIELQNERMKGFGKSGSGSSKSKDKSDLFGIRFDKQTKSFLKYWNSLGTGGKKIVVEMAKKLANG